jgi:hypothetical protein
LFHELQERIVAARVEFAEGIERANARVNEANELIEAPDAETRPWKKERE